MSGGHSDKTPETETTSPDPEEPQGLLGRAAANPAVVVSLAGALMYVAVSLGHASFYGRFGIDPAEVGLGYTETLTRAGRVFLPFVVLVLMLGLVLGKGLGNRLLASVDRARVRSRVLRICFVALVVLAIWFPAWYGAQADDVARGEPLRPEPDRLRSLWLNPLGIRAEPVLVEWTSNDADEPYPFGSEKVMYLGRADGVAVFYDPATDQTVRVPDSDVVIVRQAP